MPIYSAKRMLTKKFADDVILTWENSQWIKKELFLKQEEVCQ